MVFSWTTPERRLGHRALPIVPNEIYLEIIDTVEASGSPGPRLTRACIRTLSNLALVCRFFCAMVLPRIFKSVTFYGDAGPSDVARKTAWCRQINGGKEPALSLALYVTDCQFKNWLGTSWVHDGFSALYAKAMSRMSNLASVAFYDCAVKEPHWGALCQLGRLESLVFNHCNVAPPPPEQATLGVMRLKIITSEILEHSVHEFARAVASPSLRFLKTDDISVADEIAHHLAGGEPALEELHLRDIDHHDIVTLHAILAHTGPAITHLSVRASASLWLQLELTAASLPRVRSLRLKMPEPQLLSAMWAKQTIYAICRGFCPHPPLRRLEVVGATSSRLGADVVTWEVLADLVTTSVVEAFPGVCYVRGAEKVMQLEGGSWRQFHCWDT
ncbi:hypothetical protein BV22DRAFT_1030352 [Leucogyrophana mollusca]|uniref:Uncharacterized protein n=1 Tax=Leucogyrophana mollusca TaxID=85980 RepID=A0ACB8BVA0_9AGAM|nr:hypothetical protein BV22DRAFT_1030352 [Leucogyrophana mollusca]